VINSAAGAAFEQSVGAILEESGLTIGQQVSIQKVLFVYGAITMSIMCIIEIGEDFTKSEIENLLLKQQVHELKYEGNFFEGNFIESNMYFVCEFLNEARNFSAEIKNTYNDKIKANIILFYVMKNYDQCCVETRQIISDIRSMRDAFFVFSFEYATIYAVNDRDGYRILGEGHTILEDTKSSGSH
jgi:hypothetical protein